MGQLTLVSISLTLGVFLNRPRRNLTARLWTDFTLVMSFFCVCWGTEVEGGIQRTQMYTYKWVKQLVFCKKIVTLSLRLLFRLYHKRRDRHGIVKQRRNGDSERMEQGTWGAWTMLAMSLG